MEMTALPWIQLQQQGRHRLHMACHIPRDCLPQQLLGAGSRTGRHHPSPCYLNKMLVDPYPCPWSPCQHYFLPQASGKAQQLACIHIHLLVAMVQRLGCCTRCSPLTMNMSQQVPHIRQVGHRSCCLRAHHMPTQEACCNLEQTVLRIQRWERHTHWLGHYIQMQLNSSKKQQLKLEHHNSLLEHCSQTQQSSWMAVLLLQVQARHIPLMLQEQNNLKPLSSWMQSEQEQRELACWPRELSILMMRNSLSGHCS